MINWSPLYLDTYIPELPKFINNNFTVFEQYIDIFYDGSTGEITVPIATSGNISGAQANFVNGVFDNLVVKRQFSNLYENTTTIDIDFYNEYVGAAVSTRDASILGVQTEHSGFQYYDLDQPYIKMTNDASLALSSTQLGQEFQLVWDASSVEGNDFIILMDPSNGDGTSEILNIAVADSSSTWVKLIAVDHDASWGMSYAIKQYGGTYTLTNI